MKLSIRITSPRVRGLSSAIRVKPASLRSPIRRQRLRESSDEAAPLTLQEFRLAYPRSAAKPTLSQAGVLGMLLRRSDLRIAHRLAAEERRKRLWEFLAELLAGVRDFLFPRPMPQPVPVRVESKSYPRLPRRAVADR